MDKRKRNLKIILIGLLLLLALSPVVKYSLYEALKVHHGFFYFTEQDVVFIDSSGQEKEGVLTSSNYRFNDKWGFIDLQIKLQGDTGESSFGISPFELNKFKLRTKKKED